MITGSVQVPPATLPQPVISPTTSNIIKLLMGKI